MGLAIQGIARPGAAEWEWGPEDRPVYLIDPARLFLMPQAEEVMIMGVQKVQVGVKVEFWKRLFVAKVLKIRPGM